MNDPESYSSLPPAPDFANLMRDIAVQGPSLALFTPEDAIQIDLLGSLAGVTVTVSGVVLGSRLEVLPFSFTAAAPSNRTVSSFRQSVGSGWLQQVRVVVTTGAPLVGQTFCWIRRCRGTTSNALVLGTFQSGYLTANTDVFWPGTVGQLPLDGEGIPTDYAPANPGAGVEWSQTVPSGNRWELISVSALFTASAAVATRQPRLIIDDGATPVFEAPSAVGITASLVIRESWGAGAGGPVTSDILTGGAVSSGLPNDCYLPAGFRIRSSTGALDVGDTWTQIRVFVREWLEGN